MRHRVALDPASGGDVEYAWRHRGAEFVIGARAAGPARPLGPGSEAEFVTEHYWGYTRQRDGGTLEYQVEHPPWETWDASAATFRGPADQLYGPDFGRILAGPPQSAFVTVGSAVVVHRGRILSS
jgi:hypothetical protein